MSASTAVATQPAAAGSLVTKFADRFGVEANKMVSTLKATVFKAGGDGVTNEQMMMLLVVADQYGLNPFTRELFAFPDKGGIVPVVSVDGWIRIINSNPAFRGYDFKYGPASEGPKHKGAPAWIECTITRSDREQPIAIREYLAECWRDTGPWQSHPARMLRHKALIQCARVAFGFAGVYDEDEARAMVELNPGNGSTPTAVADLNEAITGKTKAAQAKANATDAEQVFSYAQVREAIEKSKDGDSFNDAVDMIRGVSDEAQQGELRKVAEEKRAALA